MNFLDTNALYWYLGRNNLHLNSSADVDDHQLKKFLDNRSDKILAVSAYVEALVKFRNKPWIVDKIHKFLIDKDLRLFNNVQYQGFSTDQLAINMRLDGDYLSYYIKSIILPTKINIEVRFALQFLETILLLYTDYQIQNCKKICPKHYSDIELFIKDKTLNNYMSILTESLKNAYEKDEGHEEQIFKTKYYELLEDGCQLVDSVIELLTTYNDDLSDDDIKNVQALVCKKYNELKEKSPQNYMMEHIADVFKKKPIFLKYARERLSKMYSEKSKIFFGNEKYAFKKMQIEYLKDIMYVSWMENMQKFRKNDIYDFLFLGCADYVDSSETKYILTDKATYLLTFDKKLARFIEDKNPANGTVIRRYFNRF